MSNLAIDQNPFATLDIYAENGVQPEAPRVDCISTISAGTKKKTVKNGKEVWYPVASRDGTICHHDPEGRAPGLAAMLRKDPKKLTITFPFDNPKQFIQQRFVRYSASRLEVYGDEHSLTEIKLSGPQDKPVATRVIHESGTEGYEQLRKTCKVSSSVYFLLAEWDEQGVPRVLFPDGLGFQRLRFTSRNSLSNFMAQLKLVHEFTGGRLAGVPFDLRLINREVSDSTGAKRTVPLWTITMRRPGEMAITSDNFRHILTSGLHAGDQLKLPPPSAETVEMVALEPDLDLDAVTLDEDDIRRLENGIDPGHRRRQWFGAVRHTYLDDDDARAEFLAEYAQGITSLNDAVKYLEQPEWDAVLEAVTVTVREREEARLAAEHEARNTDPQSYQEGVTEKHVAFLNAQLKRAGVRDAERFDFLSWLLGDEIRKNADVTPEHLEALKGFFGTVKDNLYHPITDGKLADMMHDYHEYARSDEAALDVLG